MVRILVVDDDPYIRDLIGLYIRREGFELVEAADGLEALSCLEKLQVDLVVLDIMMPNMDGWEFCENVKSVYDIPIIMVTAKGEPQQRIKGFELGSDDYLVKPFEPRELIFRIKALLRRYQINSSHVIQIDDVTIDRRTYQVHMGQQSVVLPPKEFDVLFKLASYPGQIFTRGQLIEEIWGVDYQGDERTVDVHVKRLRNRMAELGVTFKIATIRGLGYRLEVV
ncbi:MULTISPECIES: response regulator transcription factor [Alicyclobacillus]|uniref:Heme response regulator HssR n=1 Tax=Alicyclobacillus acidoterrestris (strain ATCC 49025 / DSM 3922 / CIP 106132 / NCIMB 13137 / GD3B) TaxID=1356854 RepID=T0BMQ3_ALIAG|nr:MULTISPECIES: response regulator transcription factor [Alicyclobacillus]EPZ41805.1 hypothetical protein N007_16575 [Alicyclobacillus acidoterrestris ATCC 49025]UNO49568.1 response regulator transcription factor [Alicyclobacillus acidoterrestris]GEO24681.1 DNA-binding response regulator [Alicyclobacillus acidoterrestris]